MKDFSIRITRDGYTYLVEGEYEPPRPATHTQPAEGGIENITKVRLLDKQGNEVKLPDFLQDALDEAVDERYIFDEPIWEALRGES